MSRFTPRVLVTGDWDHASLNGVLDALRAGAETVSWSGLQERVRHPDDALPRIDLIVIAQHRRNLFPQAAVEALQRACPLAAVVVVYADWCEGETRSGQPLQGVMRVHRDRWGTAWERFSRTFGSTGTSDWHQPDWVRDDPQAAPAATPATNRSGVRIGVSGYDFNLLQAFRDLPGAADWEWIAGSADHDWSNVDLLVVDCWYRIDEAVRVAARIPQQVPMLALLGFPRHQDRLALQAAAPESEILAKPFSNDELLAEIERLIGQGRWRPDRPCLRLASGTG